MALRALLLAKKLNEKRKALQALASRDDELKTRETELEASIAEVTEETDQETRDALEEAVAAFEAERSAAEEQRNALEGEIRSLSDELAAEEARQNTDPAPAAPEERTNKKTEEFTMIRTKIFDRMSDQQREAFFARDDVKGYLGEVRAAIREKRALQNVGLTVPTVMLGLLRQNIMEYSKLYKHVAVRAVAGDARAVVMGAIPEAIWTDCCANLNELDLGFNDLELGCWKVGGYFAVCNANIEDSDVDLAAEILTALGQAIGLALDKAILYGNGTRMPLGIVTRLAQQSEPASYPQTARPWADLHTSNVKTISSGTTGAALFAAIATAAAAAKGKYSRGEKFWAMNETTYSALIAEAMSINAAGAIVTGVNGMMPVIGGVIEVLDFIPDNVIVGGYGDLYILAERAGAKFATSEHVRFLQDQTVFKGTARYDGAPAIAEGFVVIGINSTSPTASMNFAVDKANTLEAILLPDTATVVQGGTLQLNAVLSPIGVEAPITWASATTAKATVSSSGLVTGVASGSSVITATSNGLSASCTVTVTTE